MTFKSKDCCNSIIDVEYFRDYCATTIERAVGFLKTAFYLVCLYPVEKSPFSRSA